LGGVSSAAPLELSLEAAIQHHGGLRISLIDAQGLVRGEPLEGPVAVPVEADEYPDAVCGVLVRVVSEAEAVMELAARKPHPDQCRDEQYCAERDALGVHGHRPVRDELVAGCPDAEW